MGHSVELRPDHTFSYTFWSDVVGDGRYGAGTYTQAGNQLRLSFTAVVPPANWVTTRPLATNSDSIRLTFKILLADTTHGRSAVPFATVLAYDAAGRTLATTVTDENGRVTLHLARAQGISSLLVSSLGMLDWRQDAPGTSVAYCIGLVPNRGKAYAAGTVQYWQLLRRHARQPPVLVSERSSYPLRWQPPN